MYHQKDLKTGRRLCERGFKVQPNGEKGVEREPYKLIKPDTVMFVECYWSSTGRFRKLLKQAPKTNKTMMTGRNSETSTDISTLSEDLGKEEQPILTEDMSQKTKLNHFAEASGRFTTFDEKKAENVYYMSLMFEAIPLTTKRLLLRCPCCTKLIDVSSFDPMEICCKEIIHKECYDKLSKAMQEKVFCHKCRDSIN